MDWTRGEEAKNNWSVKLDQLMELGVVFPSTVETLRKWQLQPIAQVCVWGDKVVQPGCQSILDLDEEVANRYVLAFEGG